MYKTLVILLFLFTLFPQASFAENCNDLVNDNKLDKALMCFQRSSDEPSKYVNIGTVYTLQKKYDLALKYFEMAYNNNPNNPAIKYSYGVGLINAAKAASIIQVAHDTSSNDNEYGEIGKIQNLKIYAKSVKNIVQGTIVDMR